MTTNVTEGTRGEVPVYHLEHDWDGETELSTELVLALARVTDEDVTSLASISKIINPDALNRLFSATSSGHGGELTFQYSGNTITIRSCGDVRIARDPPSGNVDSGGDDV
jgi:hypothetical protein